MIFAPEYSCHCDKLRATIHDVTPSTGNLARCHCLDCQAFAIWLTGQGGADFLDENGGSELFQTLAWRLDFTQGKDEYLQAIRLSPKGMIRWYASCCHSPIANMMGSKSMSFIGMPTCGFDENAIDKMGPMRASMFAKAARKGSTPPDDFGFLPVISRILWRQLKAKMRAKTRYSPFWTEAGETIVAPKILTLEERKAVTPKV